MAAKICDFTGKPINSSEMQNFLGINQLAHF